EPELLDPIVRPPRMLLADRPEHEAADDGPTDGQRQRDLGLDAAGETAAPIHRRLVGQLLDPREADEVSTAHPSRHPRNVLRRHAAVDGPRVRNPAVPCEFDQAAVIETEELDDAMKPFLDLVIE